LPDPFGGWRLLLAHHREEQGHHCLRLGALAFCTRCLALYPSLLLVVGLEGSLGPAPIPERWFFSFSLVIPAVVDWSRVRLFQVRGSNLTRGITGILGGLGLGLAFSDYFRDSNHGYFWVLVGSLAAVLLLVWWSGRASSPKGY
jgi:uncharacterized membrane protein